MNPTVSVIIPTYNRAPLLREAIESVLAQTFAPTEILVVDDGSTDGTRETIAMFGEKVRALTRTNGGAAAARNMGIQNAQGELVAFLDDDDVWVPTALEWQVERFQDSSTPPTDIVMGMTQRAALDDGHAVFGPWAARVFGSALVRRDVFRRVGPVDAELRYGEDVDWFLRVREQEVPLVFINKVTMLYRIHAHSLMSDTGLAKLYLLKVLKKSLARRANANGGVVKPMAEMADLQAIMKMMQEAKA